ncbi:MAG: NAD(+) diphosphatase [Rhizobiaceae bacterium]|nr:NAD(+) diphosphatase [Rhizobiaceae bacterium]
MTFRLFDAPTREPSQFVGFAGNRIDRQSEKRSDDSARQALAAQGTRILLARAGRLLLKADGPAMVPFFHRGEIEGLASLVDEAVLLGVDADGPVVALPADIDLEALPETLKAFDYRTVLMQGLLPEAETGAMAQAGALLAWHATHRFCGRCGQPTVARAGGYKRVCTGCNAEHFPRTDPVAIMLTVTRDKALLGRGAHFVPGMYSTLAGFIEPGETIEAAVRRETFEESGIQVGRVVYHASQPWPMPFSLMIGCFGEAISDEVSRDEAELEDCRWFSRDEIVSMLEQRHPDGINVPPVGAIAHHLIRFWAENG